MSLFRLDASIRVEGSVSRAIGDIVESSWRDAQPDATVTRRQIGLDPLPSTVWAAAVSGGRTEESQRSPEQIDALTLAASLVDELVDAEAILIATPLYNYGVSQHLKAWIDLAITDPRLAAGGGQPLRDKPAVLVIVRGGAYGPGTPREGWDHASSRSSARFPPSTNSPRSPSRCVMKPSASPANTGVTSQPSARTSHDRRRDA